MRWRRVGQVLVALLLLQPLVAGALVLTAGTAVYVELGTTESQQVEVISQRWSRELPIERHDHWTGFDWCTQLPDDAIVLHSETRFHHWQPGAGQYQFGHAVYQNVCQFEVFRWVEISSVETGGMGVDPAPHWGDASVDACDDVGCKRLGAGRDHYEVTLDLGDQEHVCDVSQTTWTALADGEAVLQVSGLLGRPDCEGLTGGPREVAALP